MQPYSVKLTIEGLYGAFAEKYACLIHDAHHVHRLMQQLGAKAAEGPITVAQPHTEQGVYDPIALLARLMRYLRKIAADQPTRRFFKGVRFEPAGGGEPTPWLPSIQGEDGDGPFFIYAWGLSAFLTRDTDPESVNPASGLNLSTEPDPVYVTPSGRYVCAYGELSSLFRDTFTALIEVCEDALAKNQNLLAVKIPYQPAAAVGEADH
jgi:hypothetical protein